MNASQQLHATLLSVLLVTLTTLPLLSVILPTPFRIPLPPLPLTILDHLASAFFASRYLTFLSHPMSETVCPFLLPYVPLLSLSKSVYFQGFKQALLPMSKSPAPENNACQARFSIFMSTILGTLLTVAEIIYGVPRGVAHHVGLALPVLLIIAREGCSLVTPILLGLIAFFGNVFVLAYLIYNAVDALMKDVLLARLILAERGDLPGSEAEGAGKDEVNVGVRGENQPLLEKKEKDINKNSELEG